MADFIFWLNSNQGVIALASIIISVIGFFITNNNVTNIKQSQKSGPGSSQENAGRDFNKRTTLKQKTGNNSFAQQAGRDIKL